MKLLIIMTALVFSSVGYSFDGGKYFKANCKSCHTIGGGDTVGPDLAGLSKRRKVAWLEKFINYPEGMIHGDDEEPGYKKADALAKKVFKQYKPTVMPDFVVNKTQVKEILKYIDSLGKKPKGKILKVK